MRAAEQDRPDVARHRRRWQVWQRFMESTSLVFLDESGVSTNMARRYGWGPKGERLVDAVPCVDAPSGARRISGDRHCA